MLEVVPAAVADAIFGYAVDKLGNILDGWKSERDTKKALEATLSETFALFKQKEPQWVAEHFDASFFQHEGKPVLAQFLIRDGRPDPGELAECWADSLNIRNPERRTLYVRELEPIATTFLDIFSHQLKAKATFRDINDSRVFELLSENLQAIRYKLGAEKATHGTRYDYLRWLIERNLYIDSRGTYQTQRQVQVRLDEVYVSLKAQRDDAPSTVDRRLSQELEGKDMHVAMLGLRRSRVLSNDELSPEDVEDQLELLQARTAKGLSLEKAAEVLELAEAVSRHDRLVILGDPGSGKTTLLRYLTLMHAQALLRGQTEAGKDLGTTRFPVLIRIAEYVEEGNWKKKSLSDFLADAYTLHDCPRSGLADLLQTELEKGNCLILLDGLDEIVSADERRGVVQRIEDFVRRHDNKANRFIVTSRIAGYRIAPLAAPFIHYSVRDMDETQMQRFLERWCRAVEDAQTMGLSLQERQKVAQREVDGIMKAIQTVPGVRRLATNPLLLRILALIHKTGARLPQKRVELYKLAADTLSRTWRPAQGVPESVLIKEEYLTPLLSSMAYWLHKHKPTGIATAKEVYEVLGEKWADINDMQWDPDIPHPKIKEEVAKFLVAVREHTGLFVERAPKRYGFMHLTFEEYYAARYLVDRSKTRAKLIRDHLHDSRWEEPILLALGFVGLDYPKEASELLETAILAEGEDAKVLGFTPSIYENLLGRDFLFALRCLGDHIPVRARLLKQLIERLANELLYNIGSAKFSRYWQMLQERLGRMEGSEGASLLLAHFTAALHDTDASIRSNAASGLGRLGQASPEVVTALMETLHDAYASVRSNAAWSLGQLGQAAPEAVTALIEVLHDTDASVRRSVTEGLGRLGQASPEVVMALIEVLHDTDASVRRSVAVNLGRLRQTSPEVVMALIGVLHDADSHIRRNAAWSLGRLGQAAPEAVTALIEVLHDTDASVRRSVTEGLGQMAQVNPEALTILMEALHDVDATVRYNAAWYLGQMAQTSPEVVTALMEALHDVDAGVRSNAAWSLGQVKYTSPEVVTALMEALHDTDIYTRSNAVRSLGQTAQANPEVVTVLTVALHDADVNVRGCAAMSLGMLVQATPEVITELLETVGNASLPIIRRDSIRLLSRINQNDKRIHDIFWLGLLDNAFDVRAASAQALALLGSKLPVMQRRQFEARLVRAVHAKKFEKVDNVERPASEYVYDALWLLVIGDEQE